MLKGRGGYGWVSGLLRLAMGLMEIGMRGSLGLVEIGALPLPSLPGKDKILPSNLLALPLRIAKGLSHPKSLSYIGNLGDLPIVIIALSKFPNGKSLSSLSQSLTPRHTVSLSCTTTFLCRLTGFGGDWCGSGVAGFLVFCCDAGFFFFFFFYAFLFRWDFGGQWWRGGYGGGTVVMTWQWSCGDRG